MKKIVNILITAFMIFSATTAFSATPISVFLNGIPISFDEEPRIINDRTFVPVRAIFEAMGATIYWDSETKTVTSVLGDKTVKLTVGENVISINGIEKTIDAPPQISGSRTLVPARAVAESFEASVDWISQSRSVVINTKEFTEKVKNAQKYTSNEALTHDSKVGVSSFSVMYLDGFEVIKDTPDGTDIDLSYESPTFHANLNIRRDLYTGSENELTNEYVEKVASEMVEVVSGNLISYEIVALNGVDFMKIDYTAPRTVSGISDNNSEITVYMAIKNGVVYTITLSRYGEAEINVIEDLTYTTNSIIIA